MEKDSVRNHLMLRIMPLTLSGTNAFKTPQGIRYGYPHLTGWNWSLKDTFADTGARSTGARTHHCSGHDGRRRRFMKSRQSR